MLTQYKLKRAIKSHFYRFGFQSALSLVLDALDDVNAIIDDKQMIEAMKLLREVAKMRNDKFSFPHWTED